MKDFHYHAYHYNPVGVLMGERHEQIRARSQDEAYKIAWGRAGLHFKPHPLDNLRVHLHCGTGEAFSLCFETR